ncbi:hypothetical protein M758_6G189800 [Ceratodon purpureus]|nr:hypothetical protein M758_6G189800 [Ceratodon purpureus]KAG0614606.1 hypothetical protein M758_6G189800 [Ceratodon purpureus]
MRRACSMCLINCFKLHGARGEDEDANACLYCALRKPELTEIVANVQVDRHPSFLKKITASTMSTFRLPLSFVADHAERLGDSVVLEGPGKEQWRVELYHSFQTLSINFGQGWEQFVADHVLQIGDQLAFSLSDKSFFQVEVYDGFGVQKRSAIDATNTSLDHKSIKNIDSKDLHSSDVAPVARQEVQDKPEKATQSAEQLLIDLIQSSESESRIVSAPVNALEIVEAAGPEDLGRPAMELAKIDEGGERYLPPQTLVGGKVFSQRRPVTELEKVQALRRAHALELVNPNTLMVMSKGHVYSGFWLTIPKRFTKDWMPVENKEITLLNKGGHKWPTKWLAAQRGLSAGWRRFSLDHRLEEHDVCVLELVDKAEHTLLVHIFRVLGGPEEDPGLYTSASTPLRSFEGRRTPKKCYSAASNGYRAHCNLREGQENVNKIKRKRTWESSSGMKNLKRKLCLLEDDEASRSLAKANTRLENGQDHQTAENLVNLTPMDTRDGNGPQNNVTSNSAELNPRASYDTEIDPTITPHEVLRPPCTGLVKLAMNLLKDLEAIDPPETLPASADEVHEQISNFPNVSMPEGYLPTSPSIEAYDGRKKDQAQLYKVVNIHKGRNVGNNTDFLAEIQGYTEESSAATLDRDKDTGFLWIPSDHFEWDMLHCRINS